MNLELFPAVVALCFLAIASIADIKTREVPDTINFGLIAFAIGYRLILTLTTQNYLVLVEGIAGFAVFFILALIMFYAGQWGGGDSKMLMALGALIGIPIQLELSFIVHFIINAIIIGAIWGLLFAGVKAITNFKNFKKAFITIFKKTKMISYLTLLIFAGLIIIALFTQDIFLRLFFGMLSIVLILTYFLFLFTHAVEKSCMHIWLPPGKLALGDWIVNDIKHKNKVIASKKDLGLTEEQINKIKKLKIKKVLVKQGIPFIPSFLIAFLITLFLNSVLVLVI